MSYWIESLRNQHTLDGESASGERQSLFSSGTSRRSARYSHRRSCIPERGAQSGGGLCPSPPSCVSRTRVRTLQSEPFAKLLLGVEA